MIFFDRLKEVQEGGGGDGSLENPMQSIVAVGVMRIGSVFDRVFKKAEKLEETREKRVIFFHLLPKDYEGELNDYSSGEGRVLGFNSNTKEIDLYKIDEEGGSQVVKFEDKESEPLCLKYSRRLLRKMTETE